MVDVELVVHQVLAISFIGLGFGFEYILFSCAVPVMSFFGNKQFRNYIYGKSFVNMALFIFFMIFFKFENPIYEITDSSIRITSEVSVVVFVLISQVYSVSSSYKQLIFNTEESQRRELEEYHKRIKIQDEIRMLDEIKREKERADKANRAKSEFLANMSHEIRTPINAVLGMDTMILRKSKDKEIRGYAVDIQRAGKNLLSIINDILDFSKIESGKLELVPKEYNFENLIMDTYLMIDMKAREKKLDFVMDIEEDLPKKLFGDDFRIKQILVNLLNNAVKYTHEGKVILRINQNKDTEQNDKQAISLCFAIEDTGIGVKPEDINKLTEKFVRIEESRNRNIEGTGLGINIVASLLGMMDSKLEVSSVYGEGSTFYFTLTQKVIDSEPIGQINTDVSEYLDEDVEYKVHFTIPDTRLLVVDDNSVNRAVFKNLLSDMLCQIDEAESGFECIELSKKNKYDIIFLDMMMPEMDGIETLHQMKELGRYVNSDTPVVMLTADAIVGVKENCLEEGFDAYLTKPIDTDELEETIGRLLPEEKKMEEREKETNNTEVTEANVDLPFIDGVDWNIAMMRLRDVSILMEIVCDFSVMSGNAIVTLCADYEKIVSDNEGYDDFRILVHSMKTNCATIGAVHQAGLAKYLEYASRDRDIETIKNIMPLFKKEWLKLKSDIDIAFGFASES